MLKNPGSKNNETPNFCANCGRCCNFMPGATAPEQWGSTEEEMFTNLVTAFKTGKWTIDWWEGDPRDTLDTTNHISQAMYVRPAMQEEVEDNLAGDVLHPGWGRNPCAMLENNRCSLDFDSRPKACQSLAAFAPRKCKSTWNKADAAIGWIPFHGVLYRAIEEVKE